MASKVYFWNLRTSMKMPYEKRIKKLIKRAGVFASLESKELVAVKLHFGEAGTTAFISPLQAAPVFLERVVEYAAAALATHEKTAHITFLTHVSPGCDCEGHSDAPICPDIGVLVSGDPVAVDQAALDMVNQAPPSYPSALPKDLAAGEDKFLALHPDVDGTYALDYAEKLGLGGRAYKLVQS